MKNGFKTYSKTEFKEDKHKRGANGTFGEKHETEKDKVEYHHKFSGKEHPRGKDGSFVNTYSSADKHLEESSHMKNGRARYGSDAE